MSLGGPPRSVTAFRGTWQALSLSLLCVDAERDNGRIAFRAKHAQPRRYSGILLLLPPCCYSPVFFPVGQLSQNSAIALSRPWSFSLNVFAQTLRCNPQRGMARPI